MSRGSITHWLFYTAGVLWLAVGFFGRSQLAIVAVAFIAVGAVLHVRSRHRDGARSEDASLESVDARATSRTGIHDRYEGILNSLTRRTH